MKYKCFKRNLKREFNGKRKVWTIFLIGLTVLVLIVLPSGTPDDSFTTIPLIALLGWKYFILVGIILVLFIINFKSIKKLIKRLGRKCR